MASFYTIHGATGSPYSQKVLAAFRYRRIPYVWRPDTGLDAPALRAVKVPVMPVIHKPDGTWVNDSTPFLLALDGEYPQRRLVPEDPLLRMAALLIEDFADEFLTKLMFDYRWAGAANGDVVSRWLVRDSVSGPWTDAHEGMAAAFAQRQIQRMPMVGCTPENRPVVQAVFQRLFAVLEDVARTGGYALGAAPSLADFGLYGQLSQLVSDPVPRVEVLAATPLALWWVEGLADLSGVEAVFDASEGLTPSAKALLALVGEVYLPYAAANARAVVAGEEAFALELLGRPFTQAPYKYQVRCLQALQKAWGETPAAAQAVLADALGEGASVLSA